MPKYSHEYYLKNKEKIIEANKRYRDKNETWHKTYRRELRKKTLDAYGGKCVCCGEHRWQFLTIDHPKGDGQKDREPHRRIVGQFYGWLRKQGYPQGYYQVLCMNCNWVRRYDVCPHETEKDAPTSSETTRISFDEL